MIIKRKKRYRKNNRPVEWNTVQAPDVKGPRFRHKFRNALDGNFIKAFRIKYPQYAHYDQKTIKSIVKTQCAKIWKVAAETRDGIELQSSLGHIFVGSYKIKTNGAEVINYAASIKAGTKVLHRNLNTDNHIAKIWYTNMGTKYQLANRQIWFFKGVRQFTRYVAKVYPENWRQYVVINHNIMMDNQAKICQSFRKAKHIKAKRVDDAYIYDTYNEFNI